MKLKILCLILCVCIICPFVVGCGNSTTKDEKSTEKTTEEIEITLSDKSEISKEEQEQIAYLLKNWAYSYSTHYLIGYNDCVSEKLRYGDNSTDNIPRTENYFDTVSGCSVVNVDFENGKKIDENTFQVKVNYIIVYNNYFKEENNLKRGKNNITSNMTIKQSVTGEYYIDNIE